jgi:S-layer homology domain
VSRLLLPWRPVKPKNDRSAVIKIDLRYQPRLLLCCLTISVLMTLTGCNGGNSLQNTLSPDPKLKDPAVVPTSSPETPTQSANPLPTDFPIYPQAKLQSTETTNDGSNVTTWTTNESIDVVYAFYQKELPAKQWQIVAQPSDSSPQLTAKQDQSSVAIASQASTEQSQPGVTTYTIRLISTATVPDPAQTSSTPSPTPTPTSTTTPASPTPTTSPPSRTKLIGKLPASTVEYLADLTKIGVLTNTDSVATHAVTRREYARWLVAAHNRITGTKPTQQIKLATTDTKPVFQDVPSTNPDFPSIQGLAEAGLIPSALSGDATSVLFRPEAPLTREQMILWKVPLDTRQALPAASLDAVKQTWGFQDAGKVDPKALRAVLADFQNGEQSNIRRAFGYTTLLQPKKTVNLGEVAIAIWYFGANSEGLSARDVTGSN